MVNLNGAERVTVSIRLVEMMRWPPRASIRFKYDTSKKWDLSCVAAASSLLVVLFVPVSLLHSSTSLFHYTTPVCFPHSKFPRILSLAFHTTKSTLTYPVIVPLAVYFPRPATINALHPPMPVVRLQRYSTKFSALDRDEKLVHEAILFQRLVLPRSLALSYIPVR